MPEEKEGLNGEMRLRINQSELDIFIAKSQRITGKPYQLLVREIVTAFNDDKLRILPTEEYHAGLLYSKFK